MEVVFDLESIDLGKNILKETAEQDEPDNESRQKRLEDHEYVDVRDVIEIHEEIWE